MNFCLLSIWLHRWWSFGFCLLEIQPLYRSLFAIAYTEEEWIFELFWIRINNVRFKKRMK